MRKLIVALVVIALAPAAWAEGNGLGGYWAYWDTEDASEGSGVGAKLQFPFVPGISLEIRGTYFADVSDTGSSEDGVDVDGELMVIPAEVGLLAQIPVSKSVQPYVGGGGGYYVVEPEFTVDGEDADVDLDNEFGFYAIAGVELRLADHIALFGEAQYRWVEFDTWVVSGEEFETDEKSSLTGMGFNAGLLLKW